MITSSLRASETLAKIGLSVTFCVLCLTSGCAMNRVDRPSQVNAPISHGPSESWGVVGKALPKADPDPAMPQRQEPAQKREVCGGPVESPGIVYGEGHARDETADEDVRPIRSNLVSTLTRVRELRPEIEAGERRVEGREAVSVETHVDDKTVDKDVKPVYDHLVSTLTRVRKLQPNREAGEGPVEKSAVVSGKTDLPNETIDEGVGPIRGTPVATLKRLQQVREKTESGNRPTVRLRIVSRETDAPPEMVDKRDKPICDDLASTVLHQQQSGDSVGGGGGPAATRRLVAREANVPHEIADKDAKPIGKDPVSPATHLQEPGEKSAAGDGLFKGAEPDSEESIEPTGAFDGDRRPIGSITTDIRPKGEPPTNEARKKFPPKGELPDGVVTRRGWSPFLYEWEATALCHRPLYFEEVNLERYGYTRCPISQPVLSGARFFATVPALPYLMTAQPSRECVYTLGHYRPGSCVPYQFHWMPLQPKAGLVEAAVATGLVFAIP